MTLEALAHYDACRIVEMISEADLVAGVVVPTGLKGLSCEQLSGSV